MTWHHGEEYTATARAPSHSDPSPASKLSTQVLMEPLKLAGRQMGGASFFALSELTWSSFLRNSEPAL